METTCASCQFQVQLVPMMIFGNDVRKYLLKNFEAMDAVYVLTIFGDCGEVRAA